MGKLSEKEKNDLYTDYKSKVFGYIYKKIGSWHDAEDICETVFLKVYSHIDDFDETKSSVSTWIYNITRNTLYDHYRTTHISETIEDFDKADDTSIEDDICNEETLDQLANALEQLDERERDIILLHYYKGETLTAISQQLGISYSYVKLLHNKALGMLKEYF